MGFFLGKFKKGFTLVELLIVMAVLSVMATGVIILLNPAQQLAKSRDARRKSDLHEIQQALDLYYNDHSAYPSHCDATTVFSSSAQPWIPEIASYMKTIPTDPSNTYSAGSANNLVYQYQSKNVCTVANKCNTCDTQHYTLGAQIEVSSDPNINWDKSDFGGGVYVNYVVGN